MLVLCSFQTMPETMKDVEENKDVAPGKIKDSVRSSAIVKYAAVKNPDYLRLAPQTDLKLAPANWLRKTSGLRPEAFLPGNYFDANVPHLPKSFSIAHNHLSSVGDVDVISDAAIIKKLLKTGIPYNKSQISIAVHKIGKTLLLENFDLKKYIAEESEWKWFKDFYNQLLSQVPTKLLKKKRPSSQYERLMLSKFLYYSINDSNENRDDSSTTLKFKDNGGSSTSKRERINSDKQSQPSGDALPYSIPLPYITKEKSNLGPVHALPSNKNNENRWQYWLPHDMKNPQFDFKFQDNFERNILWTFEDLKMLLGSNMPIFGGGEYPAVSLVLQDSNKPINILTGIDYWLDNLICNVPELVMCFHVNGIVKNYEVIKTEDIPKLTNPVFKPQIIKDIAQNVLSFLKSNCTKEGHTYWLFKGSEDDVVKLYDLTTLMEADKNEANDSGNPYTFSVAMLLFRTAINLLESQQNGFVLRPSLSVRSKKDQEECHHKTTIKTLLNQTIQLLENSERKEIVFQCLCCLSSLCLPANNIIYSAFEDFVSQDEDHGFISCETCDSVNLTNSPLFTRKNQNQINSCTNELAKISSVKDLSVPQKFEHKNQSTVPIKTDKVNSVRENKIQGKLKNDCALALDYIGKSCVLLKTHKEISGALESKRLLAQNGALAYYCLASIAQSNHEYGHALRHVKLGLICQAFVLQLDISLSAVVPSHKIMQGLTSSDSVILKHRLMVLCGDLQLSVATKGLVNKSTHISDYHKLSNNDEEIKTCFHDEESDTKFDLLTKIYGETEAALDNCTNCYRLAMEELQIEGTDDKKKGGRDLDKNLNDLCSAVARKRGYVENELGSLYLNHAVNLIKITDNDDTRIQHEKIWKVSFEHFLVAYKLFERVSDVINQALVLSNKGRLMRICAQVYGSRSTPTLSQRERHFYSKAVDNYRQALSLLESLAQNKKSSGLKNSDYGPGEFPGLSARENVSWELSSTYFNMACILQDNATDDANRTHVEKEVTDLLNKSLRYCAHVWENTIKVSLSQYRQATIHYRIATLQHNSYRFDETKNKRILADSHYKKSIDLYRLLDHPCDLLRVYLEKMSLQDIFIQGIKSAQKRMSLVVENVFTTLESRQPLRAITTELTAAKESSKTPSDENMLGECAKMLPILAKLLLTYQHTIIKLSSSGISLPAKYTNKFASKSKADETVTSAKSLYNRSLRSLHHLQNKKGPGENNSLDDISQLLEDIEKILSALDDTHSSLFAQ